MNKGKPNPKSWQKVAEEQGFFACTGWSAEDIQAQAEELGMEINERQAIVFLREYYDHIVDNMVRAGWDAITYALYEERG